MLNATEIDGTDIIERIEDQIKNYYYSEENEQEQLVRKYEDLEEDLNLIFKTKYILVVKEKTNRDNRKELEISLKVDNVNYFDGILVVPNIDEKELRNMDTMVNASLIYLTCKDENFININQL